MTVIHDPGGNGFRIERLWAYLSVGESDNDEGVCAFSSPQYGMMPMVAADDHRLADLAPIAQKLARFGGHPIMLARFDRRTDMGLVIP